MPIGNAGKAIRTSPTAFANLVYIPIHQWPKEYDWFIYKVDDRELIDGEIVYGHYRGPVTEDIHNSQTDLVIKHWWFVLSDDTLVDPLRWYFTGSEPSFFVLPRIPIHEDYDPGGRVFRSSLLKEPPEYDPNQIQISYFKDIADKETFQFIDLILGYPEAFCYSHIAWLSKVDPLYLQDFAVDIYELIFQLGYGYLIPLHNRRLVLEF